MESWLREKLFPAETKDAPEPGKDSRAPLPGPFWRPESLETDRLRLRKLRLRDAKDLYAWTSDREVARYVLWDAHRSLGETRDYIRYVRSLYRRGLPASWGIELKESGKVIGTIGVMSWNPDHRWAEVGYSLGKAWWHQGYAAEALGRLIRYLTEERGVHRVEAMCDVRNPASARVMEKCGMQREGTLRQKVYNKGEYADVALYSIIP